MNFVHMQYQFQLFLKRHESLYIKFGVPEAPLNVCSVATAAVDPPPLFETLRFDCNPMLIGQVLFRNQPKVHCRGNSKTSGRRHHRWEQITVAAQRLVTEGGGGQHQKKRLFVDYLHTINRFTWLDSHPIPNISQVAINIAGYDV